MDYEIAVARRALSPEEATKMVGLRVREHEPNVTGPTVFVTEDDEPILAYLPITGKAELRRAVMNIPYGHTSRANGIQNVSRTFGYAPRKPVHGRDGCRLTHMARIVPAEHSVLEEWAVNLEGMLEEIAPEIVKRDRETMTAVLPDWRIGESNLWTSGVVNRSSSLPYHRDGFNFPTWSAMPVLRRGMDGGYLRVPEYDLTLACRDGYAVFFPGHQLVHGVTPMTPNREDGYRYSVVYYALRGMKDCFTYAVETAHAKRSRTAREREMSRAIAAGEPLKISQMHASQRPKNPMDGNNFEPVPEDGYDSDPHADYAAEMKERDQ
jgi:hypothetical protein